MRDLNGADPRRFGPYRTLAVLREAGTTRSYLARGGDGRTVTVTAAEPRLAAVSVFRSRFRQELAAAARLAGPWAQPVLDSAPDDPVPWFASPFTPSLSLAEAVALTGPLPEPVVRALGAALAETLERTRAAAGGAFQGLGPEVVLLAADGPRISAFGPLGAATAAAEGPGGGLAVTLGYLTPEQVAGHRPGPPADVFVLGTLLAYAATGTNPFDANDAGADPLDADHAGTDPADTGPAGADHSGARPVAGDVSGSAARHRAAERIARQEPDLASVPEELRPVLARCLAKDPAQRPEPSVLAAVLAPSGAAAAVSAGRLPARLTAALAEQASAVLGLEAREDRDDREEAVPAVPATPTVPDASPAAATGASPASEAGPAGERDVPPARPTTRRAAGPDRRALLTGVLSGAAGLALGGGVTAWATDDRPRPAATGKPAARKPREPVPGVPPAALWAYDMPDTLFYGSPALHGDVLLLPGDSLVALDVRTGRELWRRKEPVDNASHPVRVDDELLVVLGVQGLLWRSVKDGARRHKVPYGQLLETGEDMSSTHLVARDGAVVWFKGNVEKAAGAGTRTDGADEKTITLFAYDVVRREPLWRRPLAEHEYVAWALPHRGLLVSSRDAPRPRDAKARKKQPEGLQEFYTLDRASGEEVWARTIDDLTVGSLPTLSGTGTLYAAQDRELRAYELRTGRELWRMRHASPDGRYGEPVLTGDTLYVADNDQVVYALDPVSGRQQWSRKTGFLDGVDSPPSVAVSASGAAVLSLDAVQVTAFAAASGERLWKFQAVGEQDTGGLEPYGLLTVDGICVVRYGRSFYGVPVE
ncbi:outer membrane protein assembly factor BamB family protein [Streptomyces sp. CB02400]|uniref:outer membrane protein assembly factor BamB family protein n=1 Tax=Streptomyces sp. CB02400 TaxID=1703944 RepID=UPI000AA9B91A|nr:PQQ-binding-like beta-propeller repeat protein [Streptomyces sp. CB02400]